ncbi:MAG: DNA recombination protein RmuC [Rhizobiales bacterium]|nr:DNA recombination protein RmuC [Hyphomicrobiales bacterium]
MSESLLLVLALIIAVGVVAIIVLLLRPRAPVADPAAEQRLADLNARIQAMGEMLAKAQSQLQQTVHQRLDAVTQNLGESMKTSTKNTTDHLKQLHERLAVIDSAQKNITDLASTVTSLQKVFDNKQRRGAFGQGRMEAIVADGLPQGAYEFQFTLSNNSRPDCCIHMPDNRHLIVDAKFPLEATTQDVAFMFIPSESMFAELYDAFDDVLQKGYRAGVIIVSPSLLMLAIQVVQQIQKDARMREAADKILKEVALMIEDVQRLKDRVENLDKHFGNVNKDIEQIVTSAEKILSRGEKIKGVDFNEEPPTAQIIPAPMTRKLGAGE